MSRVTEVRFVGYGVPDLAAECDFYCNVWGLRETGRADGIVYLAADGSEEPYVVRLRASGERRVEMIGLAADDEVAVVELYDKIISAGCKIIHEPKALTNRGGGYGFQFFSSDGLPFEISSGVDRHPAREVARWEAIPEKISHVVLHSPDHRAAAQFFIDVLGFRLSDWVGDFMVFLRCNEWHHRIAFLPGPPSLNHVAYDVPSVDDMMRGIQRLKAAQFDIAWGPGRHTAGNNTFSYFLTPNGFSVEYTSDLERIDEATWQPKVHIPGPMTIDQWGIGVGGPHTMPPTKADPGLFRAM